MGEMLHRCLLFTTNIKSIPLLIQVGCLLGLSWQLFQISGEYFKYKVNIQTTVFIPEQVEDLSMGICIPIQYAIDYKKFNTEVQYNWTPDEFGHKRMFRNLSIHEIYNYTYHADKILYLVSYPKDQGKSGWKLTNFSSVMKMEKYYFSSTICYLYSVRFFKPFSVDKTERNIIMFLLFGVQISQTSAVVLFIAPNYGIPFREIIKAAYIPRGYTSIKLDKFESSHYSIRKELLPPPYETSCFSYSNLNFTNSIECIERCVILKCLQKWGEISIDSLAPNKIDDYKFINSSNFTKKKAELDEIRVSCELSCPNTSCEDTYIVTIQESGIHFGWDDMSQKKVSIVWGRKTSSISSTRISCRPTSTLPELILFMMSSISTWTGLSMMSINPILLIQSLSKTNLAPRILPLQLRRRDEIKAMHHTIRVSRLENRVVTQNLAIERLRQMVFQLHNDRNRSVRY